MKTKMQNITLFFSIYAYKKMNLILLKKHWIKWRVCECLMPLVYIHSILVSFADMKYGHCHQLQLTMVKRLWHLIFLKCLQMHAHPDQSLTITLGTGCGGNLGCAVQGNNDFRCSGHWDDFSGYGLCLSHEPMFYFHIYHDLSVSILFFTIYYP